MIEVEIGFILRQIHKASLGRRQRRDVREALNEIDHYADIIREDIRTGNYLSKLHYKVGEVTNKNGKHRITYQPDFYTLVVIYVGIGLIQPYYQKVDVRVGLNCIKHRGITAKGRNNSVVKRAKHAYFDRPDLTYVLSIDMRKCYMHFRPEVVRKALKGIGVRKELNDFVLSLSFVGKVFPVGTPLSPLIHHIVLSSYDRKMKGECMTLRYADNVFCFCRSKEQAQRLKWRTMNHWWYELKIRAKRHEIKIVPMSVPLDICGFIFHRNHRAITSHDKGYVTVRKSTLKTAMTATGRNWSSYFGTLQKADTYSLMRKIEQRMKLKQLTDKIRIKRNLDAKEIHPKELAETGQVFTIYDYEMRKDSKGNANWIKCLIGYPEIVDGEPTGRIAAREFHGGFSCLVEFHTLVERQYGQKQNFLPIEDVSIENHCGYVYKDSTNTIDYIEDESSEQDSGRLFA